MTGTETTIYTCATLCTIGYEELRHMTSEEKGWCQGHCLCEECEGDRAADEGEAAAELASERWYEDRGEPENDTWLYWAAAEAARGAR